MFQTAANIYNLQSISERDKYISKIMVIFRVNSSRFPETHTFFLISYEKCKRSLCTTYLIKRGIFSKRTRALMRLKFSFCQSPDTMSKMWHADAQLFLLHHWYFFFEASRRREFLRVTFYLKIIFSMELYLLDDVSTQIFLLLFKKVILLMYFFSFFAFINYTFLVRSYKYDKYITL